MSVLITRDLISESPLNILWSYSVLQKVSFFFIFLHGTYFLIEYIVSFYGNNNKIMELHLIIKKIKTHF